MRALREDERDEIEALKYLIKHVNTKKNIEHFKIWDAVMQLDAIGKKYVLTEIVTEDELNELLDLDDMKELIGKLVSVICEHLEKAENIE